MDRLRCEFVQCWRFSSCDVWKGGQQPWAALPAHAGSRHSESWEFGSSPSCSQHAAVLPRRHLLGEQERKQPPPPHPGAAQSDQEWSVHPSQAPASAGWQQPHGLVGIPAKRVRHGRRKRQRIGVCPMGQTDDAAWAEEKLLQSSAICCSSQFPALCLSFPIHGMVAKVGAACKAFCFESCCRKMFYPHKELLKAAACPSPCPARCPWIPPQDGSHPGFISSAAAVSGLCCLSSHSCSTPHLCSCLKHFLNAPQPQTASSAPDLRDAPG